MQKIKKILLAILTSTFVCLGGVGCAAIDILFQPTEQSSSQRPMGTVEIVYAKAQELGFEGSLEDFLALVQGKDGTNAKDGVDGVGVADAYVANGVLFVELSNGEKIDCGEVKGDKGDPGADGKSAYELYKEKYGYEGTEEEWLRALLNGELAEKVTYTVSFETNGGTEIEPQEVAHGAKVVRPEEPEREGYVFDGWYVGEEKWSFIGYTVTEDIALTAKWSRVAGETTHTFTVTENVLLTYGNAYRTSYADTTRASIQPYGIALPAGVTITPKSGYLFGMYKITDISELTNATLLTNGWTSPSYTTTEEALYGITLRKSNGTTFDFTTDSIYAKDYLDIIINGTEKPELLTVTNEHISTWAGKKAIFIGDSITYGVGTTTGNRYWELLGEKLGFEETVGYGVSGSCLSATSNYGTQTQPLVSRWERIANANPDADLAFIFMGTNDYGHSTPLGSNADTTDVSFYGALNIVISGLKEKLPNATICYMTPLHRTGETTDKGAGVTLEDYVNVIESVCAKYSIPVIDAYSIPNFNPNDAAVKAAYFPDGLHPNAAGHAFLVNAIAEEVNALGKYNPLRGLNLSVLGDSISTYEGWSNDMEANSTIGNNVARYPEKDVLTVDKMWWKQTTDNTGMDMLVVNTWRGTRVTTTSSSTNATCMTRSQNLHDNVGENAGTLPDVIAVYMGINDFDQGVALGSFASITDIYDIETGEYIGNLKQFAPAYATMIHKMRTAYPNATIFCFTHVPNGINTDYEALEAYNDAIRYIAEYFGCELVDLYKDSGITAENYRTYTHDGLHPYANGMELIADCFERALIEAFKE